MQSARADLAYLTRPEPPRAAGGAARHGAGPRRPRWSQVEASCRRLAAAAVGEGADAGDAAVRCRGVAALEAVAAAGRCSASEGTDGVAPARPGRAAPPIRRSPTAAAGCGSWPSGSRSPSAASACGWSTWSSWQPHGRAVAGRRCGPPARRAPADRPPVARGHRRPQRHRARHQHARAAVSTPTRRCSPTRPRRRGSSRRSCPASMPASCSGGSRAAGASPGSSIGSRPRSSGGAGARPAGRRLPLGRESGLPARSSWPATSPASSTSTNRACPASSGSLDDAAAQRRRAGGAEPRSARPADRARRAGRGPSPVPRRSAPMRMVLDRVTGELLAMVSLPDFDPNRVGRRAADRVPEPQYRRGLRAGLGVQDPDHRHGAGLRPGGVARPVRRDRQAADRPLPDRRRPRQEPLAVRARDLRVLLEHRHRADGVRRRRRAAAGGVLPAGRLLPDAARSRSSRWCKPRTPRRWADITVATTSFGHGIAVTPLQFLDDGRRPRSATARGCRRRCSSASPAAELTRTRIVDDETAETDALADVARRSSRAPAPGRKLDELPDRRQDRHGREAEPRRLQHGPGAGLLRRRVPDRRSALRGAGDRSTSRRATPPPTACATAAGPPPRSSRRSSTGSARCWACRPRPPGWPNGCAHRLAAFQPKRSQPSAAAGGEHCAWQR